MTGGELSAEERRSLGCQCVRLDAVWHHVHGCPVPLVTPIVAALVAAVEAERDEVQASLDHWQHAAKIEADRLREQRDRAEAAEAKFRRCLESENRAQAALAATEAEVARLIAQHDECHHAFEAAKTGLVEAQAENRRLAALVEAGLALADGWEQRAKSAETGEFSKRERWAPALRARASELRATLGGAE